MWLAVTFLSICIVPIFLGPFAFMFVPAKKRAWRAWRADRRTVGWVRRNCRRTGISVRAKHLFRVLCRERAGAGEAPHRCGGRMQLLHERSSAHGRKKVLIAVFCPRCAKIVWRTAAHSYRLGPALAHADDAYALVQAIVAIQGSPDRAPPAACHVAGIYR